MPKPLPDYGNLDAYDNIAFAVPQGPGFCKGGDNDSTGNTFVCVESKWRCVAILPNDVWAEAAFPAIVRAAIGETGAPWRWES